MAVYLAPYRGTGTHEDPFVPRGSDQPGWSAIDLRADARQKDGWALLHVPEPMRDRHLIELGSTKDEEVAQATRQVLSLQLFRTVESGWTFGEVLGQVLMFPKHGAKKLLPAKSVYEVWLNNEPWFLQPAVAGGATYSDDFNRANGDIGANWTAITSFVEPTIVSNQVRPAAADTAFGVVYYNAGTFNDNQWASIELTTITTAFGYLGPMVRGSASVQTCYYTRTNGSLGATADGSMTKWLSGTESTLWTFTDRTVSAGTTVKLEAQGSSLRRYENGALITTQTDTSITSGYAGFMEAVNSPGLTSDVRGDNWQGGDVTIWVGYIG